MEKRKTNPHLSRKRNFQFDGVINMKSLMALKRNKPFTKAVSNMAVMDITDIKPLFTSVYKLLEDNGVFVFATQHP